MSAVIASLSKAFAQLSDPAIVRIAVKSIGITLLLFIIGGIGLYWGLIWLGTAYDIGGDGWVEAIAALLLTLIGFWFLFRVVAMAVLQFFADTIVAAVEARHYPDLADKAVALPFAEDVANSVKGFGRALGFNLLALPVAAVLIFTAFGPAVVFLLVNAILLGRELTDMAWLRHTGGKTKPNPVRSSERLYLGAAIAAMMLVPFLGLIAPVVGAAAGTHLAHNAMRERDDHA